MGHDNMIRCDICGRMAECEHVLMHSIDMNFYACAGCFPLIKEAFKNAVLGVQESMEGELYWKHTDADKVKT